MSILIIKSFNLEPKQIYYSVSVFNLICNFINYYIILFYCLNLKLK